MRPITIFSLLFLLFSITGCDVIAGIFKAGFWVGIVMVIIVVLVVLYIVNKLRKR
ncbi:MAG: hypothetical protein KY428_01805 [Bacteroidetes bacterium]|nr:hypothetical protein [Bacteroidota bacterium]